MNLVLIGYRGSGKTTVGKLLADRLKRPFIDCDDYIEQKTMLSIREIFELCGESYFRLLESEAIKEVSEADGQVIAPGGGAVLRYKNVSNLKQHGLVVYLEVEADVAYERITRDPQSRSRRPSLTDRDMLVEVREQVTFRIPYYARAADYVVNASKLEAEQIAAQVLKLVGGRLEDPDPIGEAPI